MTDAAVLARTGRDFAQWFAALDKAKAAALDHKGIVALLDGMGAPRWYRQMIAVSFERARGLRAVNQKCDGEFAVGATRVMPVSLPILFARATAAQRAWFPKGVFEETSRTKDKYWRGKWRKTGRLSIGFIAKGSAKSQIAVDCEKLSGPDDVEKTRAAWKKALTKLETLLEA